ncbi:MAG: helix-turn-helix transcriptional regulator [Drouetiella hepatica Uher 2000/2452]|jgi:transcriptional regulator with XRE-family HTH domain|uniref:Helix-turn-helix transcriptional regulator n=1 Tax=Drouetiella hepatica Uher 2000/2452 TaxID=904376 RepID=A0A951QDT7_9CYAN|nr:helix-turn-helix transcriptional regulator [Drouetiella hepatica Uher 2000/2452]
MNRTDDFLWLKLNDLKKLTGISNYQWSRWFNGMEMTERSINQIAEAFDIRPSQVLDLVNERRRITSLRNNAIELPQKIDCV